MRAKKCPRTASEGISQSSEWLCGVGVGFGRGRRTGTAGQRERLALIERADAALVETGFLDLQIGAVQRIRRQFLDREANGFGRGAKSPICKASPLLLADRGRKQLGGGIVTEGTHGL